MAKMDKQKAILGAIKDNTKAWSDDVYAVVDKMTATGKKLSKILGDFSFSAADKDRMAELVSALSGETVAVEKEGDMEFAPLTALYITGLTEKHKHTYTTGEVVICVGDGVAINAEGKVGSMIPPSRKILRPATDEEIAKISDVQIKGVMKETNIVIVG